METLPSSRHLVSEWVKIAQYAHEHSCVLNTFPWPCLHNTLKKLPRGHAFYQQRVVRGLGQARKGKNPELGVWEGLVQTQIRPVTG